jgi:hypothetical protein
MRIKKVSFLISIIFVISSTQFALAQSEKCSADGDRYVETATVNIGFEDSVIDPVDGKSKYDEKKKQIELILKDDSFKSLKLQGVNYSINVVNAYVKNKTFQLSGTFIYYSDDIDSAYEFIKKVQKLDVVPSITVDKTKVESCNTP